MTRILALSSAVLGPARGSRPVESCDQSMLFIFLTCAQRGQWVTASQNRAAVFAVLKLIPTQSEFEKDLFGVLAVLGRPRENRRGLVELDRTAHEREWLLCVGFHRGQIAVGLDLGIVEQFLRGL